MKIILWTSENQYYFLFIEFVAQIVRVIFLDFSFVELRTCSSTTEKDNFVLPEGRSELILQFF